MTHLQSKFEISEDLYDPFANFVTLYGAAALIAAFKKRMAWFVELILKAGNGQLILEAADFAGCYEVALIHEAASLGLSDMVHLFLSYGKAKPQTKGLYGRTVLHAAVRSGKCSNRESNHEFFGFRWIRSLNGRMWMDGLPYTYCEMFGFQEILYYLTSMQRHQNFDPFKTKLKMDLLFIRAWNNQLNESTDYLYTCVNKQNALDSNRTILHYCSERGHSDSVQKLLEKNANIDAMDDNGLTSLHIAAENGHVNVVEALLKAGCLVDVPTSGTDTPTLQHCY
ncbi:ankyrin repeat-containing domain protein [Obelidium mucronatum]|nr:ankyrin repeat-containing domain protein [Obelidium mucronatum]